MEPARTPYLRGQRLDLSDVVDAVGQVPQNVQRDGGADAGPAMHLAGVAELLFDGGGRRRLKEFSEAGAGVGESPGRQFDTKNVERLRDGIDLLVGDHDNAIRNHN